MAARLTGFALIAALTITIISAGSDGPVQEQDPPSTVPTEAAEGATKSDKYGLRFADDKFLEPKADDDADCDLPAEDESNDLFVFIPGSHAFCSGYNGLLDTVGANLRTLCIEYDNLGALYGDDYTDKVDNHIEPLIKHALVSESSKGVKWAKCYLDAQGEPKWGQMRISGHSQGGVLAVALAYQHKFARVALFNSPSCQWSEKLKWMKDDLPMATPADRIYALESKQDGVLAWHSKEHKNDPNMGCDPIGVEEELKLMEPRIKEFTTEVDIKTRCGCGKPIEHEDVCCWDDTKTRIVLLDMKGVSHTETIMGPRKLEASWRDKYWKYVVGIKKEYGLVIAKATHKKGDHLLRVVSINDRDADDEVVPEH